MIRTEKTHLKSVARSHAGMSGKNNEDRFGVSAFHLDEKTGTPVLFAVLADGIGGHHAGEVAAEMVVDIVSEIVSDSDGTDPLSTLRHAVQTASNEIYKLAQTEEGRKGMGATVVCTWIIGKRLFTAYVGDSRIYLIRDGEIFRLTRDHSWIQEAVDSGILTPEQAVGHPNAHVIRRYVGSPEPPDVDFRMYLDGRETSKEATSNQGVLLKNGDRLFLCSDGLTDLVEDAEILDIIEKRPAEDAVDHLIDLANERGGHDNITNILITVPEGVFVEKAAVAKPSGLPFRSIGLGCLALLLMGTLAAAGFFGLQWLNNREPSTTPTLSTLLTDQPIGLETSPVNATNPSGAAFTPFPTMTLLSPSNGTTLSPAGDAGSSEDGNIPPPPNADNMTAFPTNTLAPTMSSTPTQTTTPTSTSTP